MRVIYIALHWTSSRATTSPQKLADTHLTTGSVIRFLPAVLGRKKECCSFKALSALFKKKKTKHKTNPKPNKKQTRNNTALTCYQKRLKPENHM